MSTDYRYERCLAFVQCQLQPASAAILPPEPAKGWRAVTISRQTGSRGYEVAEALADYLQARTTNRCPWTVFDRNLVERVLAEHHLPGQFARFMPEDRHSEIENILGDVLGVHPPSPSLVAKMTQTIQHLAELGNVILLGRGANVITRGLDYVFHVRLIGSLERRVEYIRKVRQIGEREAREFIHSEDRGRDRYLKTYFHKDVNDPLLYHLTINSDLMSSEKAAEIIGEAITSANVAFAGTP
jgi:cytidylate kinase